MPPNLKTIKQNSPDNQENASHVKIHMAKYLNEGKKLLLYQNQRRKTKCKTKCM